MSRIVKRILRPSGAALVVMLLGGGCGGGRAPNRADFTKFKLHWSNSESGTLAYSCMIEGSDCDTLEDVGFNIVAVPIVAAVQVNTGRSDYATISTYGNLSVGEVAKRVTNLHRAGFYVLLLIDILFLDGDSLSDTSGMTQALAENATYQSNLKDYILAWASFAESKQIAAFAPMGEVDKMMFSYEIGTTFMQGIYSDLNSRFDGLLGFIGTTWYNVASDSQAQTFGSRLSGYDFIGSTLTPFSETMTLDQFKSTDSRSVDNEVSRLSAACTSSGAKHCIMAQFGTWGHNNSSDWITDADGRLSSAVEYIATKSQLNGLGVFEGVASTGSSLTFYISGLSNFRTKLKAAMEAI